MINVGEPAAAETVRMPLPGRFAFSPTATTFVPP